MWSTKTCTGSQFLASTVAILIFNTSLELPSGNAACNGCDCTASAMLKDYFNV